MPQPSLLSLANTFGQWLNTTNDIITASGNSSEYILVSQNATPVVSTGNVSVNGTLTLTSLKANSSVGTDGQFLTSNGSTIYWSTLSVVDANSTVSGLVNTAAQSFAGVKTFTNNVAVLGYLTVGNNTITLNSTTLQVGNSTSNLVINSTSVSLDGGQIINSSGTSNNATNLNGQPASYYTNASNLSDGTVPLGRLSSANSTANGVVNTAAQSFAGNKTFLGTTSVNALSANGGVGTDGQFLTSNGSTIYWSTLSVVDANSTVSGLVNTAAQTFAGNKTFLGTTSVNALSANGGVGTSGQFLTSNGSTIYWSTLSVVDANSTVSGLVNTAAQTFAGNKTFQNTTSFSNTVSISGAVNTASTLGVAGTVNALSLLGVSGNATFAQDVTIVGSLTVSGTTTYINTTNLQIGDNIVALNADLPSNTAPTENAGLEINRGSSANTYFRWNETGDVWEVTSDGTNYATLIDTRSSTGINASALSTGTVPNTRLDANVILTTSTTGINASALSTGTVPIARLDANVILTTSTTGINASALSTGTVPDGRVSGAYTSVTALSLGANVVANVTTIFVGNSTANTTRTATSFALANSTNTATLTPISLTIGSTVVNTTATSLGGTLSVAGAANVSSTLGVAGVFTAAVTSTLTGAATLSNTLAVTGAATLSNTLAVTGAITITTGIMNANTSTGISANGKMTFNTTNGRFVLPVGVDKWAL